MASAPRQQLVLLLLPSVVLVKPRKLQQLRLLEGLGKQRKPQQLQVLEVLARVPRHPQLPVLGVLAKQHKLQQLQVLEVLAKLPRRLLLQHSVASDSLKPRLRLRPSGASGPVSGLPQQQPLWPPHWEASGQRPPQLLRHSGPPIPVCLVDWPAPLTSVSLSSLSSSRGERRLCTSL